MAHPDRKAALAALIILLITVGVIIALWFAWGPLKQDHRMDGLEARVEENGPLPTEPPEILPPTTNPTGQTGGTPADETPPPDERPVSNND